MGRPSPRAHTPPQAARLQLGVRSEMEGKHVIYLVQGWRIALTRRDTVSNTLENLLQLPRVNEKPTVRLLGLWTNRRTINKIFSMADDLHFRNGGLT
jgi:hypothetical protein